MVRKMYRYKRGNFVLNHKRVGVLFLFSTAFFCFIIFFALRHASPASADSCNDMRVKGYSRHLIRKGENLSAISQKYYQKYSHGTAREYMENIICFNDMESEYIRAGEYLLIPDYT